MRKAVERRWTPRHPVDTPLDLLVVGHTNVDHILHVPRLPARDRTVPVKGRETRLGGTAANIARSAAGWGVRTGLVSRVGTDFPPGFRAVLEQERVDLRGLAIDPTFPSSSCYIAEDGQGGQWTLIDQGPMRDEAEFTVPEALFAEAPWTHLTTGAPRYLFHVKEAVDRAGGRVAVDPAQEVHYRWSGPEMARLLEGAEILFGNDHEIRQVLTLLRAQRPEDLLDRVPLIVMTRGGRGVTAVSRTGRTSIAAERPRRLRQVTGAGDAFRGGFYAGWFEGTPLVDCLRAGTRSARRWIEGADPAVPARSPSRPTRRRR
ncbi:MAG TPA: PfkB family carbohydrate kinase [Thermoplasmata archaeon]